MTTLRRELRKAVLRILESNISYWQGHGDDKTLGDIADEIVDYFLKMLFKGDKDD